MNLQQGLRPTLCVAALLAVLAAGCNTSSNPFVPPPPAFRVYVTNGNSTAGQGLTSFFKLPLTAAPASLGSFATNTYPWFECADSNGRVFVMNYTTGTAMAFPQPITSGAAPAFTLNIAPASTLIGCVFDASNNMYLSETDNKIDVIPAPVTASSTVTSTITASVIAPYGVAVDAAGDVFVANGAAPTTEYAPLSGGNALLHTFGNNNHDNEGLVVGLDGNLYSANNTANGTIDVFKPPFTNATIVDHGITPPGATLIYEVKFDSSGNMLVSGDTATNSVIWTIPSPYTTGTGTASIIVAGTQDSAVGLAIAH